MFTVAQMVAVVCVIFVAACAVTVGATLREAAVVKFHVVVSVIPANTLSDASLRAQAATWI